VNILSWLFGTKKTDDLAAVDNRDAKFADTNDRTATAVLDRRGAVELEADNLRRWKESGQARVWFEAHQSGWNHADWLALLEQLKHSSFWPMQPDAVGMMLEETKREWLQRN
jgi:hypothetical protein